MMLRFVVLDKTNHQVKGGVPPGYYTAFAVLRDSKLDLEDPAVRKQIESYGKSVQLDSGKAEVLELSLVPED